MKKISFIQKLTSLTAVVFLLITNDGMAQSYFAGNNAGFGNTSTLATGVGASALRGGNSGAFNAAFGNSSLRYNTTGSSNTAYGAYSLYSNLTNNACVAVGRSAMYSSKGDSNIAIGFFALSSVNTGSRNVAIGTLAMQRNISGVLNVGVGHAAINNNTSGNQNAALGSFSLYSNTTGSRNTAIGSNSLYANTTGEWNTAVGLNSAASNISGSRNTSLGYNAMYSNKNGSDNVVIGNDAGLWSTSASKSTIVGVQSFLYNSTGFYNSSLGYQSGYNNTTGNSNTAVGAFALNGNRTGYGNIAVGMYAGSNSSQNPQRCTFIGLSTGIVADAGIIENSTAIGNEASVDSSNKIVLGNTAITSIGGQVGWTTYSDRRLKTNISKSKLGLEFIMALNPVIYNYKAEGQKAILYTGLIAQEVDEAAKNAGAPFSGVDKNGQYWGIRYGELTVPLIKAMQEMVEKHTAEMEILNSRIEKLEAAIASISQIQKGSTIISEKSFLFQNQPNPFNAVTTIRYVCNEKNALLVIRDLNGRALKQTNLALGKGSITMNAGELPAGTYTYSLIINGECADTKLMVMGK
jgi:hypothetical protein